MTLKPLLNFLSKNASTICAVAASLGVIATGVSAGIATKHFIEEQHEDPVPEEDTAELVKRVAKHYAVPVIIGGGSICCIVAGQRINLKKQGELIAALGGASSLAYSGVRRDPEVTKKTKKVFETEPQTVADLKPGDLPPRDMPVEFREQFTGRTYISTLEEVESAQSYYCEDFYNGADVPLSVYHNYLGVPIADVDTVWGFPFDENYCEQDGYVRQPRFMNIPKYDEDNRFARYDICMGYSPELTYYDPKISYVGYFGGL